MTDQEITGRILQIVLAPFRLEMDRESEAEAVKSAFSKIESLEPAAFKAVCELLNHAGVRRLLVAVGLPAAKYLEYALKEGREKEKNEAIKILDQIAGSENLASIMNNPQYDTSVRVAAATQLGQKQEIDLLGEMLSKDNEDLKVAAVMGLNASMMHIMPGEQLDDNYEPVILQFSKLLNDPNVTVRSIALDNLNRCKRLSVDTIDQVLHDDSSEVREIALRALLEIGIEKNKTILLAEVIEDPVAEISSAAIESITHPWYKDKIDPQTLADAIIDLLVIRKNDLPPQNFSPEQVVQALQQTVKLSPPLREWILVKLCDLAYSHQDSIRTRSIRVARRLGQDDFSALVQERSSEDPSAARVILSLLGSYSDADAIIRQFSEVAPDDVKSIAALQTGLLQEYYENALEQTKTSFRWAIISTMIGFGCLVASVVYLLITTAFTDTGTPNLVGILTGVSSVLSQFIAGVQFLLYDRAGKRLAQSQLQLHQVQRFQLANSVCESLEGKAQHKARADLVKSIANLQMDSVDLPITNNAG